MADPATVPRLELLGEVRLTCSGRVISPGKKALGLLTYLALEGGDASRERIASLLWSESSTRSALHSLSQSLYALRKQGLADEVVVRRTDRLGLKSLECDYHLFLRAFRRQDGRAAAALVRGNLCDGLYSGSVFFDQWLDGKRALFQTQLYDLLQLLEHQLEWRLILRVADLLRGLSGEDEQLSEFERLAKEALATADPEIATSDVAILPSRRLEPKFVGRDEEIRAFSRLQSRVAEARVSAFVAITGSSGIGKSALGQRLSRLSALRGWRVLSAQSFPAERNLPLGVVDQLLSRDSLRKVAGRLPTDDQRVLHSTFSSFGPITSPATPALPAEPQRLRLFKAVHHLLLAFSEDHPLLLWVDDYQWADPTSRSFFHYFSRAAEGVPQIWLTACNLQFREQLQREIPHATLFHLSGLELQQIEQIIAAAPEAAPAAIPAELESITGGNPLLIRNFLTQTPSGPGEPKSPVPSATTFFRRCIAGLSADAKLLLGAVAVLQGNSDPGTTAEVAGLEVRETLHAAEELWSEGLLRSDGPNMSLIHRSAGEVLLAEIEPIIQRLLYARAARLERSAGRTPPAVRAVQFDIAGESSEAYATALQAAEASLRLAAYPETEFFYKLALSHAGDTEHNAAVRLRLAQLQLNLGRPQEAVAALAWDRWHATSLTTRCWRDVLHAGADLFSSEDVSAAMDAAWVVAESAERMEVSASAQLLSRIAAVGVDMGRLDQTQLAVQRLLDMLPYLNTQDVAVYRDKICAFVAVTDSVATAKQILQSLYSSQDSVLDQIHYLTNAAVIDYAAGDLHDSERAHLVAIELCERHGIESILFQSLNNLSVCYIDMGKFRDAEKCLTQALNLISHESRIPSRTLTIYDNLGLLYYEQEEHDRCLEHLAKARELNQSINSRRSSTSGLVMRGLANLALGRLPEAFECERELRQMPDPPTQHVADVSYVEIFAARMLQLRGDEGGARKRLVEAIEAYRDRDFFGRARLQIELLELEGRTDPTGAAFRARELEAELAETGAVPLLARLRALIANLD